MIKILKARKKIAEIDTDKRIITTQSWPLRRLVKDRLEKGIVAGIRGWYDKKQEVFIDTTRRLFPKDGKKFWTALEEELILEGYDIS